jgi:hypothetical protein
MGDEGQEEEGEKKAKKTTTMCTKFKRENLKGKGHFGGMDVDRRIILKWIIKK